MVKEILICTVVLLCLPHVLQAQSIDFTHNTYMDTALYKAQTFKTTITGTLCELYGTILNAKNNNSKVSKINFNITNGNIPSTFTLILDSIYVRVEKRIPIDTGYGLYSKVEMAPISLANIQHKDCHTFAVTLQYPHTANPGPQYRVQIRIFGCWE
jgi:hypothetical protein